MKPLIHWTCGLLSALSASATVATTHDLQPGTDTEVVEVLPMRVNVSASTPTAAALAARRWLTLAREAADPRYLGRAQGVLTPWWDKADAPAELAVLQATVEQSRHEFKKARSTLQRALQADPSQVQGWLTLATLERVASRYPAAEAACRNVARHGAAVYATACLLENRSLQGQHAVARAGLNALISQVAEAEAQAWLLSLLAESEERAGLDDAADSAYRRSLAAAADGYTSLAYSDLLLRRGRYGAVLDVLTKQPASDAVLLRRARAMQMMNNPEWHTLADALKARYAAIAARGDGLQTHARERSLLALWLDKDPKAAWDAAQTNLRLQKEPLDWLLALQTSDFVHDAAARTDLINALRQCGLHDARLARWQAKEVM